MNWMRRIPFVLLAVFAVGGLTVVQASDKYEPTPKFCVTANTAPPTDRGQLCSTIPGDIAYDRPLTVFGYRGFFDAPLPTSQEDDLQTPFDNLSWQSFVALNWTAGKETQPAEQGLQSSGPRVWETWKRPGEIFPSGSVQADCMDRRVDNEPVFSIASDGKGKSVAQHEEYIQASTGDPVIDVAGNWTIYERRLNGIEESYVVAPDGDASVTLTTALGQANFIKSKKAVYFPGADKSHATGAIEVKAAWRILDLRGHPDDATRFYVIHVLLAVAPDLVKRHGKQAKICAQADLGLVAMHIIQKNNLDKAKQNLQPEWFWSTFEHIDNAPLAAKPCDPSRPEDCKLNRLTCPASLSAAPRGPFSYFNSATYRAPTNRPPRKSKGDKFYWSPTEPYAKYYLKRARSTGGGGTLIGTQVTRCWKIYPMTARLNDQWRTALKDAGSVFANYILVGTQWGANFATTDRPHAGPADAVPNFLSNTVLETYLQTAYKLNHNGSIDGFNTGSCVSCHATASFVHHPDISMDFSFLPNLVTPKELRRIPIAQPPR